MVNEQDPGLAEQPTGDTGWVIVCGSDDDEGGAVIAHDERFAALAFHLDHCGPSLRWLPLDFAPGLDATLLWLRTTFWQDDMEFHVVESETLVAGYGADKTTEDLVDFENPEVDEVWEWLGLGFDTCTHAVRLPAMEPKPQGLGLTHEQVGWTCFTCGLMANTKLVFDWLRELILARHAVAA